MSSPVVVRIFSLRSHYLFFSLRLHSIKCKKKQDTRGQCLTQPHITEIHVHSRGMKAGEPLFRHMMGGIGVLERLADLKHLNQVAPMAYAFATHRITVHR